MTVIQPFWLKVHLALLGSTDAFVILHLIGSRGTVGTTIVVCVRLQDGSAEAAGDWAAPEAG